MKTYTRNRRRKFIEQYEYAPDFVAKLEDKLGDRATALRALKGLDAWFLACLHAEGRMIGMPSEVVDVAWHEFILRTREYTEFCERAFGHYLHHTPESTMTVAASSLIPTTLDIVDRHQIPMVLFTADEDTGWAGGNVYSDVELRRMRESFSRPPEFRKRRRSASSSSSSSDSGGWWMGGFLGGDGGSSSDGGGGGCGGGGCGGGG
ncbi:hypothetical protein DVA67_024020 [Solirubrobacter sp. CPCC 204708]|uniref:TIGR04222 domain-containing membrane protein n=1 Tax=Solirubrobacter deserti TaxID=2282478 RepID=A0ABT4RKT9_9ACTN|nr:hypothetical protein [Solirubrobacter deserti]MBE2319063.1 hypothetical protein [Solirubrobacter deserti]MDA0139142.1 hypothetical protein [Solirubrobacter deserti]